jgi:hypothetical protein
MAMTLAEIRAKLQANENRGQGNKSQGDNAIYAHWNIPENTTARIRFLPDADSKNNFFWIERAMIRLPFAGIKGQADSKPVTVQVPCMEMWNEACPILAEVRPWFKDPNLEEMGRKYWKKRSYLFQGFVRDNPIGDDKTPENPIRRFIISPQIFNLVKNALMDPDMENLPTDYEAGLDFNIKKTSKGGYADYNTSTWARKESALTAEEAAAIEQFGLHNLSDFLPKKPGEVELQILKEMFEASVDGQPYDPDRWANYFKPSGFKGGEGSTGDDSEVKATPVPQARPAVAAKATVAESAPWEEEDEGVSTASAPIATPAVKPASSQKAEDILAMIRNRKQ